MSAAGKPLARSLADQCAERQLARREPAPSNAGDWYDYATVGEMRAYLAQTQAEADAAAAALAQVRLAVAAMPEDTFKLYCIAVAERAAL